MDGESADALPLGRHAKAGQLAADPEAEKFGPTPVRWLVLAIFALGSLTNAVMWINFAPITSATSQYFGVSTIYVNALSMSFMALYVPGTVWASREMMGNGLRGVVVTGSVLQCLGAWLRVGGAVAEGHMAHPLPFAGLALGQILGALAQPFFTNSSTRLAAEWFPPSERDVATMVGSMFNPLGNAVGQVVPAIMVSPHHPAPGMVRLLLLCAGAATVVAVVAALQFRSEPENPPSRSASHRRSIRRDAAGDTSHDPWRLLLRDAGTLLRDGQFLLLVVGFGIGLGLGNALLTVIESLVAPCGYSGSQPGILGGLVMGAGLLGAGVVSVVLDRTHAYHAALRINIAATCAAALFMLASLREGDFLRLAIAFGAMGLFLLPLLPVTLQNAAESTFPVPEEATTAVLLIAGQFSGVAFTSAYSQLLRHETCSSIYTPTALMTAGSLVVAAVPLLFFRGEYKRLMHEGEGNATLLLDPSHSPK